MFLEKFSRYFRRYEFSFYSRKSKGPDFPLIADGNEPNFFDAMETRIKANKAYTSQSNGDVIELISIFHNKNKKLLVLLFHRTSPNASDPMYRKKSQTRMTIRPADKKPGEVQALSAHMVISLKSIAANRYPVVLEEIPGLSMGVLKPILTSTLQDYKYDFEDSKGNTDETYCVLKALGVKSESLTNALQTGKMEMVTLRRPAKATYADSEGLFHPVDEVMKIKVEGTVDASTWFKKLGWLVTKAKSDGWENFSVDIDLDDSRSKTIRLEHENEANEILFVRSEFSTSQTELTNCSLVIVDAIVKMASDLLAK